MNQTARYPEPVPVPDFDLRWRIALPDLPGLWSRVAIVTAKCRAGELSITGEEFGRFPGEFKSEYVSGGQIADRIRGTVPELAALWERWHLNKMRPLCSHQLAAGWRELAQAPITVYHWIKAPSALNRPLSLDVYEEGPHDPAKVPPTGYRAHSNRTEGGHKTTTAGWVKPDEHPAGLLCKPCPECGFRYGTEWLHEPLPVDIRAQLEAAGMTPMGEGVK